MSELAQIIALLAVIGLLIVWSPPIARGRKPQPGDEVCPMCKRALLEAHHHGVTVLPRLTGSPEEALTADHLLAVLTEWAEGEEGEGCRWCMFSEGHEEGCPVGEARALIARLEGQPVAEEPR